MATRIRYAIASQEATLKLWYIKQNRTLGGYSQVWVSWTLEITRRSCESLLIVHNLELPANSTCRRPIQSSPKDLHMIYLVSKEDPNGVLVVTHHAPRNPPPLRKFRKPLAEKTTSRLPIVSLTKTRPNEAHPENYQARSCLSDQPTRRARLHSSTVLACHRLILLLYGFFSPLRGYVW